MLLTSVETTAMTASMTDVVSNTVATAGIVAGGAPALAPLPAGTDEASALATANVALHSANFLAVAAASFAHLGLYAGALGFANAGYEITDLANGSMFL